MDNRKYVALVARCAHNSPSSEISWRFQAGAPGHHRTSKRYSRKQLIHSRSTAIRLGHLRSARPNGTAPALEVRATAHSRNGFFDALRALQHERLEAEGFIYLSAPLGLDRADIRTAASYAEAAGIAQRLCLGYPYRDADSDGPALCAAVEAAGLRVALERVDADCRFADFVRYPVCAVRFHEALTGAAPADPGAACILEAMVNLARNLGIVTIATNVSEGRQAALADIGLQYLGEEDAPGATARRTGEPARTSSRSQYQGALYGP